MGAMHSEMSDLEPGNQACVSVYRAANLIARFYGKELRKHGLTFPGLQVMMVLWHSQGNTVGSICRRLSLDSSTVTPILKRLEASGLLRRFRDRLDERRVIVTLTEKGDEFRDEAGAIRAKFVKRSGLGLDELAAIKRDLDGLTSHLTKSA